MTELTPKERVEHFMRKLDEQHPGSRRSTMSAAMIADGWQDCEAELFEIKARIDRFWRLVETRAAALY